jgi:hypothetical protein
MRGLDGDTLYRVLTTLLAVAALIVLVGLLWWGTQPA